MDLDITSKTQKTARQFHINAEQLAFADLVAVGWPIEDAWAVAIRKGATWNRKAQQEAQETLLKNEGVQQRIDDVQSVLAQKQTDRIREKMSEDKKGLLERATNKEQKLIELQTLIENGGLHRIQQDKRPDYTGLADEKRRYQDRRQYKAFLSSGQLSHIV